MLSIILDFEPEQYVQIVRHLHALDNLVDVLASMILLQPYQTHPSLISLILNTEDQVLYLQIFGHIIARRPVEMLDLTRW